MTIEELSDKELTLVSSLVKQNKDKLEEIITGARKVNDARTKRLIEIVEMVIDIKGQDMNELLKKYNITKEWLVNIIKIDQLTTEEVNDLDYLEDRIETHLSWG